jgi:CubicO group peptidase (beta-lactamase class C family)
VRSVSGMPLPRFLQERIFEPVGLTMTMDPTADIPDKATGYADARDGRGPQAADWRWEQIGGTGIQATPSDLVRWADNYRTGKVGGRRLHRSCVRGHGVGFKPVHQRRLGPIFSRGVDAPSSCHPLTSDRRWNLWIRLSTISYPMTARFSCPYS